jgi:predicted nucleotidyltransferase
MSALPIAVPSELIAEFCRRNHIRKLSFFGSVLTPRFGPDSDVDVLVEFEARAPVSYFDLVRMEMELSEVIGPKVDLRTPQELSRYFRDNVVASALPEHERS